ncbi:hypothetical protein TRFO_27194 [Tritrichomonas foetus]|uniref:Diacylglycerol kinase n=1 Tax=Tritrichomonas foetus TaxID=1144522 RepID=A0A1J4K2I5_9EUKA|nr:hypothetical protein TRFO_27194 [Tritrichomonas foetus]|eukprot:OHT05178.1 hypothetical protein TRFO_27194 [Tritrichomonas foetus]
MTEEPLKESYTGYEEEENLEIAVDEPIPPTEKPLILFVNPKSGGGLGQKLVSKIQSSKNIYIVLLPEEQNSWPEKYQSIINAPNLRVCAAGGDGTVNWVITLLKKYYTGQFIPPLAVIPFGTGNDMSRSLKWGKGMKQSSINRIGRKIEKMLTSDQIENIDVWNLEIEIEGSEPKNYQMLNYFSIGVDAAIALNYEELRQKQKPKSQFESLCLYVPAGSKVLGKESKIKDYMHISLFGENDEDVSNIHEIDVQPNERTFVLQSTLTMYGGKIDWTGKQKPSMSDGKLEVKFYKGVTQLTMCQMGLAHCRSHGQAKGASLRTDGPCCFQVDGESQKLEAPALFTITKLFNYPFILPVKLSRK